MTKSRKAWTFSPGKKPKSSLSGSVSLEIEQGGGN